MANSFDPILIPYKLTPPAYTVVTQSPIPTELPFTIPYKLTPPAYANVSEVSLPLLETSPDPSSFPYLETSELNPPQGATDVLTGVEVTISCGDRTPEDASYLTDLLGINSHVEPSVGLDPAKTSIWLQVNSDPPGLIYDSGVPVSPWDIASEQNRNSGFERDILAGYTYTIQAPPSRWPSFSTLTFSLFLQDYGGKYSTERYSFSTAGDADPPIIDMLTPTGTGVIESTDVTFRTTDSGSGVDPLTLACSIGGVPALVAGVFQTGYSGSITANGGGGYDVIVNPDDDLPSYTEIEVIVSCEDTNANYAEETWSFTTKDYVAPTITDRSPTGVDENEYAPVYFIARDTLGSGINPSRINVVLDGTDAIVDGVFQSGYSGTITSINSTDYEVEIYQTAPFPSFGTVLVECSVEDNEGQFYSTSWAFYVRDYLGVLVVPTSPTSGQTKVPRSTNISLRLQDEQDISLSSIKIEVDVTGTGTAYVTAFEAGVFTVGWNGPAKEYDASDPKDVRITLDPVLLLPTFKTILVRVSADDAEGNPIRL